MVGRGTRRHPGKQDCLAIDLVGVSEQHDLVTVGALFDIELPDGASIMGDSSAPRYCAIAARRESCSRELVARGVELFDARRFQSACGDGLCVLPSGDSRQVALVETDGG